MMLCEKRSSCLRIIVLHSSPTASCRAWGNRFLVKPILQTGRRYVRFNPDSLRFQRWPVEIWREEPSHYFQYHNPFSKEIAKPNCQDSVISPPPHGQVILRRDALQRYIFRNIYAK